MTFQKPFLETARSKHSDNRKKPKTPQIKIKNPLKKDIYVNAINLVADIYFSLKGRCEVVINGNPEFTPKDNAFKLRKEVLIPLENQILKRGESIEIYVWNPFDFDDVVELSAQIIISENSGNVVLAGQAVDDLTMKEGISGGAGDEFDTHDIFPYRIYQNETKHFLINTKGRDNILLTMAASGILPPSVIDNDFTPDAKPNYETKITTKPDARPNSTHSGYSNGYVSLTSSGRPNNFTGYRFNGYYENDYQNLFESCTMLDGTALSDVALDDFSDLFVLIDSENTNQKNVRFDFANNLLFDSVDFPLMYFLERIERKYERSRSYYVSGRNIRNQLIYAWRPWSAYSLKSTSYKYLPVQVRLLYTVEYVVESSNDISFANPQTMDTIKELSATKEYRTSHRYIRIRRVIKPSTLEYEILANAGSAEQLSSSLEFPDLEDAPTVTNLIDLMSHGGIAKLYFQLKGVNDEWFTILPTEELGAVTQGNPQLIQYDVKGIPPSQSRFRAVLEVAGALQTGVTIDLVA